MALQPMDALLLKGARFTTCLGDSEHDMWEHEGQNDEQEDDFYM